MAMAHIVNIPMPHCIDRPIHSYVGRSYLRISIDSHPIYSIYALNKTSTTYIVSWLKTDIPSYIARRRYCNAQRKLLLPPE